MNFNNGDNFNGTQQSQQQSHLQVLLDSGNKNTSLSPSNFHSVKFCCGKICKGLRDLKMHQCTCLTSYLPKSCDQWNDTNLFFMVSLMISGLHSSIFDDSIDLMNSTIYNYFYENFGYWENFTSDELVKMPSWILSLPQPTIP